MLWSGYPINQGPYYSIIYCSDLKGQIESLNPAWGERRILARVRNRTLSVRGIAGFLSLTRLPYGSSTGHVNVCILSSQSNISHCSYFIWSTRVERSLTSLHIALTNS